MTKTILFTCTMNSVRSPIAAALYSYCSQKDIVMSAGIVHGQPDAFVKRILLSKGIDISDHESKTCQELKVKNFDTIFTLSKSAYRKVISLPYFKNSTIIHWAVPEPNFLRGSESQTIASYENILNVIIIHLEKHFSNFKPILDKIKYK